MKIQSEDFRVKEGDEVNLEKWPTHVHSVYNSKKDYDKLLQEHVTQLSALQHLHYASNRHALLLIFQAMDAAGKDGAIRHVMSGVNPQGCQVFSFKHPSATELEHDFLWRSTRDLPERGRIGIFNRSYYEEVLIIRVHPELLSGEALVDPPDDDKTFWHQRYRSITNLERHLHANGTPHRRNSSFTFRRTSSASAFLPASTSRTRTGNSVPRISRKGNSGSNTCEGVRGLPRRDQHERRSLVCRPRR